MSTENGDLLDLSYNMDAYYMFLTIYSPIGFAVNALGALCILLRSSPEMGAYKWYLLNYQIWGTLIDVDYGLIQVEILFPLPGGRSSRNNHAFWKFDEHYGSGQAFCLTAGSGAALVACFAYRYNVVLSALGRGLSQRQLFGISVALHIFMVTSIGVLFSQAKVPYDLATRIFIEKYPHLVDMLHNERINVYWPDVNPVIIYIVAYATVLITVMGTIGVTLYTKTMKTLNHLRGLISEKTFKMNKSFTTILLLQAVVPFTLLVVPLLAILIIIIGYFNHSTGIGMTFMAILSTHASGNTLVLLLMVKSYRNFAFYWPFAIFRQFQRLRNKWRARRGLAPKPLWQSAQTTVFSTSGGVASAVSVVMS